MRVIVARIKTLLRTNMLTRDACVKKRHPVRDASLFGLGNFALFFLLYLYYACLDCVLAPDNGNVLPHRESFEPLAPCCGIPLRDCLARR